MYIFGNAIMTTLEDEKSILPCVLVVSKSVSSKLKGIQCWMAPMIKLLKKKNNKWKNLRLYPMQKHAYICIYK